MESRELNKLFIQSVKDMKRALKEWAASEELKKLLGQSFMLALKLPRNEITPRRYAKEQTTIVEKISRLTKDGKSK